MLVQRTETHIFGRTSGLHFMLAPGQVQSRSGWAPFPEGSDRVVTGLWADVVDAETHKPTPLSEVYLHHWLMYPTHGDNDGPCFMDAGELREWSCLGGHALLRERPCKTPLHRGVFGVGAESRFNPFVPPDGYGVYLDSYRGPWRFSFHVISLFGTADPLACRECLCTAYANQTPGGGFRCCHTGARCATSRAQQAGTRRAYSMRYTVRWLEPAGAATPALTPRVAPPRRLRLVTSAPSGGLTYNECEGEYAIPRASAVGGVHRRVQRFMVAKHEAVDVAFTGVHLHAGGLRATVRRVAHGEVVCHARPGYDEGFVVHIHKSDSCRRPWHAAAGELFELEVVYNATGGLSEELSPAFAHTGVMGYLFLAVAAANA